jgi:hypothetical protein
VDVIEICLAELETGCGICLNVSPCYERERSLEMVFNLLANLLALLVKDITFRPNFTLPFDLGTSGRA